MNELGELPSFKDRQTGDGYSIDVNGNADVPESIIRTLITKFLNSRFCKKNTDLNIRTNSLEKAKGFEKWDVKNAIIHLETEQIPKVLLDKYGYQYANGNNETVPLSFYFDMSGSMSKYTSMLAVIAIELLKKDVKVILGVNQYAKVQIESIEKNLDIEKLVEFLNKISNLWSDNLNPCTSSDKIKYKLIDGDIDDYLIDKKAEKCVIFADFDPINSVKRLSNYAKTYWFCFEEKSKYEYNDLSDFYGFSYPVQSLYELERGLIKVNSNRFEALVYTSDSQKRKVK